MRIRHVGLLIAAIHAIDIISTVNSTSLEAELQFRGKDLTSVEGSDPVHVWDGIAEEQV